MPEYITVVYEVNDKDAFKPTLDQIRDQFLIGDQSTPAPFGVVAMSLDHEMRRADLMEEAAAAGRYELIEELASRADVGNLPSLDALET